MKIGARLRIDAPTILGLPLICRPGEDDGTGRPTPFEKSGHGGACTCLVGQNHPAAWRLLRQSFQIVCGPAFNEFTRVAQSDVARGTPIRYCCRWNASVRTRRRDCQRRTGASHVAAVCVQRRHTVQHLLPVAGPRRRDGSQNLSPAHTAGSSSTGCGVSKMQ